MHKQNQIEQKLLHQGVQTIKKNEGSNQKSQYKENPRHVLGSHGFFSPILFKHPLLAYAQHLAEKKGNKNWDEAGTGGGGREKAVGATKKNWMVTEKP